MQQSRLVSFRNVERSTLYSLLFRYLRGLANKTDVGTIEIGTKTLKVSEKIWVYVHIKVFAASRLRVLAITHLCVYCYVVPYVVTLIHEFST